MRKASIIKMISDFVIGLTPITLLYYNDIFDDPKIITWIANHKFDLVVIFLCALLLNKFIDYTDHIFVNKTKQLIENVKSYRSFLSGYIDGILKDITDTLDYTESERLTVFLYSSSLNKFFSIGRYSLSSKYNKTHRYIIDNEKEYVYSVLNDEDHYEKSPNISNGFFSFSKNKRNMESNDMYGIPLFDEKRQNKIGVVIVQTMKVKMFTSNKRNRGKLEAEVKFLNDQINKMNIEPNTIVSSNKTLEGM